jgi:hypothetical protein
MKRWNHYNVTCGSFVAPKCHCWLTSPLTQFIHFFHNGRILKIPFPFKIVLAYSQPFTNSYFHFLIIVNQQLSSIWWVQEIPVEIRHCLSDGESVCSHLARQNWMCESRKLPGEGGAGGQSCRECLVHGGGWQVRTELRVKGGTEKHEPCMNRFGVSNYWWVKDLRTN